MLIAQDEEEIYIVIASFDKAYVRYVCGEAPQTNSVLTMEEYGPFPVRDKVLMRFLGEIVLAYAIQGQYGETHGFLSAAPAA